MPLPDDHNGLDDLNERLKIVHLMDCDPGMATKTGLPIVILRLACGDQIEQSLMLSRWDAKRLMVMLLLALQRLGDERSGQVLAMHFPDDPSKPSWAESGDPAEAAWPAKQADDPGNAARSYRRTHRAPKKIRIVIQRSQDYRPRTTVWVHGGYRLNGILVLLVREKKASGPVDELIRIIDGRRYVPEGQLDPDLKIADDDWKQFLSLPEGAVFKLAGKDAVKVPPADLQGLNGKWLLRE